MKQAKDDKQKYVYRAGDSTALQTQRRVPPEPERQPPVQEEYAPQAQSSPAATPRPAPAPAPAPQQDGQRRHAVPAQGHATVQTRRTPPPQQQLQPAPPAAPREETEQMSLYVPAKRREHAYGRPQHGAKPPADSAQQRPPEEAAHTEQAARVPEQQSRARSAAAAEGRVPAAGAVRTRQRPHADMQRPARQTPAPRAVQYGEDTVTPRRAAPASPKSRRAQAQADDTRDFQVRKSAARRGRKPSPAPGKYRERDSAGKIAARGVGRFFGVVGTVVAAVLVLAFGAITVVCKGPFPVAKELFVVSVNETSAVKFLSRIYFSKAEVEKIIEQNAVQAPEEVTDTTVEFAPPADETVAQDIEIVEVNGPTFVGKLMIVHDPSRVRLATLPAFGKDVVGKRVEDFVAESGAIAGINAGGFADDGGVGKGGQPLGLMIHDGQIVSGGPSTSCNVVGLTFENQLVVGTMTGADAVAMGVRDAVYFEPTLIVNGNPVEITGTGGGVNPRTAIGQRADGAILLLVIDGRQPHSVGATLEDVMKVMLDNGAVNASNLDGGSSSVMVYEGEVINVCASLYGSRAQPAAFIVQ